MRNIVDYEQQYISRPFERAQEKHRRKLIKSVITKYAQAGDSILEIGCGASADAAVYGFGNFE